MSNGTPTPEAWLIREDSVCYQGRLARLDWLATHLPDAEYWVFSGGLMSKFLFEEARYCFVYGQFLATTVLGLSYIEHTLAGLFYAAGRNDLERASISVLSREALESGWINRKEFDNLQHARRIRNPVTHFRRPGHDHTVEYRAFLHDENPYTIIETDAKHVMEIALHLLGRNLI